MGLCCSLFLVPSTQKHKQKLLIVASGRLVTNGLSKSSRVAGTPFPATWHHVGNTMLAMCSCSNLHPTPTGKPGPGGTGAVLSTLNKTLPVNSSLPLIGGWDALPAPFSVAVARPFPWGIQGTVQVRDWFLRHELSHPDEKSSLQRPWLWAPHRVKGHRTTWENPFFPSTMWVPGLGLSSWVLVTGALVFWASSLAPLPYF